MNIYIFSLVFLCLGPLCIGPTSLEATTQQKHKKTTPVKKKQKNKNKKTKTLFLVQNKINP
jgi:hypothetical protein